jgi:predicted O-methyltransferase YrrM
MNFKKMIKKALPKSLVSKLKNIKNNVEVEKLQLNSIDAIKCNSSNLISARDIDLNKIFTNKSILKSWEESYKSISAFEIPDFTGGVNPGDRKAIFFLMRYFEPTSVLEVGTHIGASTINIAAALDYNNRESNQNPILDTIDIRDVNCTEEKPWIQFKSKLSPQQMLDEMKLGVKVKFLNQSSLDYLKNTEDKYDIIFLDGDHASKTVYREIPSALKVLRKEGLILLHDYFEDGKSPWVNDTKIYGGPYLAIKRLIKEGADLKVLPLGKLPWKTKLNTNYTSLALLVKN